MKTLASLLTINGIVPTDGYTAYQNFGIIEVLLFLYPSN